MHYEDPSNFGASNMLNVFQALTLVCLTSRPTVFKVSAMEQEWKVYKLADKSSL